MKIRIKGNSIRFRLTRSEVERFDKQGRLEEKTSFPDGAVFSYALNKSLDANKEDKVAAIYSDRGIQLKIPDSVGENWLRTEAIGIYASIPLSNEDTLSITIEKDFACMNVREGEDESNNYPNPNLK